MLFDNIIKRSPDGMARDGCLMGKRRLLPENGNDADETETAIAKNENDIAENSPCPLGKVKSVCRKYGAGG